MASIRIEVPEWNARHGFMCLMAMAVSAFVLNEVLALGFSTSPLFSDLLDSDPFLSGVIVMTFRGILWLILAYVISHSWPLRKFVRDARLDRPPTLAGWLLAWVGAIIGFLALFLVQKGLGGSNEVTSDYARHGGMVFAFFTVYSILFSPFIEEVVVRGFVYPAFRGSLGCLASTVLIIGATMYFHRRMVYGDPTSFFAVIVVGAILCMIREYSGNTWNCLLFHGAYNAVCCRQWQAALLGMMVLLVGILIGNRSTPSKTPCSRS